MLKSNYLLLSEGITLDQITGLASVYNIVEKFQSQEFPFIIPKLAMLAFFERKNESTSRFEIQWKLSNGDQLIKEDTQIIDFDGKQKHKWLNIFQSFQITQPGELTLSLFHEGKEINRYEIEVEKVA